ncbi:hypothetical protein M422DRAFT_259271 [Sphaerobolus stellatus SS14]|uniref:Uncharacterized protein n=1 Tax=Sphaerobolus stellatus (strain SS14) TaxID=990650 RepID=A0A0C9U561_SPHS4|nr:hypothetical protein M422DRAFT_259271 [Sphaerobolus stellatus SS14]
MLSKNGTDERHLSELDDKLVSLTQAQVEVQRQEQELVDAVQTARKSGHIQVKLGLLLLGIPCQAPQA